MKKYPHIFPSTTAPMEQRFTYRKNHRNYTFPPLKTINIIFTNRNTLLDFNLLLEQLLHLLVRIRYYWTTTDYFSFYSKGIIIKGLHIDNNLNITDNLPENPISTRSETIIELLQAFRSLTKAIWSISILLPRFDLGLESPTLSAASLVPLTAEMPSLLFIFHEQPPWILIFYYLR